MLKNKTLLASRSTMRNQFTSILKAENVNP